MIKICPYCMNSNYEVSENPTYKYFCNNCKHLFELKIQFKDKEKKNGKN